MAAPPDKELDSDFLLCRSEAKSHQLTTSVFLRTEFKFLRTPVYLTIS